MTCQLRRVTASLPVGYIAVWIGAGDADPSTPIYDTPQEAEQAAHEARAALAQVGLGAVIGIAALTFIEDPH